MNHGSLFSGIGGFDLAAEWMGWNNVFHCELNPFGQKVLKHYWPNAIQYHDITKTDFTIHRGGIDILTGGFPCQPYSAAGKRKGTADSRHLWPEMLRAIREIQPTYFVGENVRGLTNWNGGMVFDQVQADLEAEGFEVLPFLIPACAVNAPHRRDRIWFVAYSNSNGQHRSDRKHEKFTSKARQYALSDIKPSGSTSSNSDNARFQKTRTKQQTTRIKQYGELGESDATDTNKIGLPATKQNRELARRRFSFNDQRSAWAQFPTQSPICFGDDGLSTELDAITFSKWRNESIKAGGNAIVPQLALQIFKAIDQTHTHSA